MPGPRRPTAGAARPQEPARTPGRPPSAPEAEAPARGGLMPNWFEIGDRMSQELAALDAERIGYEIDSVALDHGVLRLHLELPAGPWGEPLALSATFPDEYPYLRPLVVAPGLSLARHQHPFVKNLCLLGRSTLAWDVDQTLAQHLCEQLPLLLDATGADARELAADPNGAGGAVQRLLPLRARSLRPGRFQDTSAARVRWRNTRSRGHGPKGASPSSHGP